MIRTERQAKILQTIREKGYVQNDELSRLFNVTPATIRRDLKSLSKQNLVRLDHGGSSDAGLLDNTVEPLYETKVYVHRELKQMIGAKACALITDDDTVFLDSGTTNAQIAHALRNTRLKRVTVITCDLIVAKDLCAEPNINVVMLGGILRKGFYSAYGPYTEQILRNVRANKFFLGIDAANKEIGVSNIVLEELPIKQLMIHNSDEVITVADSSKFNASAPYKVCDWTCIDKVVTDNCLNPDYHDFFESHNIETIIVNSQNSACE